jgi:hypothetical protein
VEGRHGPSDHHISVQYALFSAPSTTCPPGTKLEARCDRDLVKLYRAGALVKVHQRKLKGGRSTDPDDDPPERTAYAMRAPDRLIRQAMALGPTRAQFAERLLDAPFPWSKLRQGQKLLRLAERYAPERLEAACARALGFDLVDARRLERILVLALEHEAQLDPAADRAGTGGPALVHGWQAEVRRAAAMGSYFSINGRMLETDRQHRVVDRMPRDRILTETDSPFAPGQPRVASWTADLRAAVDAVATLQAVDVPPLTQTLRGNLGAYSRTTRVVSQGLCTQVSMAVDTFQHTARSLSRGTVDYGQLRQPVGRAVPPPTSHSRQPFPPGAPHVH